MRCSGLLSYPVLLHEQPLFPGVNLSTYTVANRSRILSDAIPALSLPVGANPVLDAGIVVQNSDMMARENWWSSG